jgi:hypothetical protein
MGDEMRQIATLENDPAAELTGEQLRTIAALASNGNVSRAADAAGVHRATIYRWIDSDPVFMAELVRLKNERREALAAELCGLAEQAIGTIRDILEGEAVNPSVKLRAALAVLGGVKVADDEPRSIHPADIKARMDLNTLIRSIG